MLIVVLHNSMYFIFYINTSIGSLPFCYIFLYLLIYLKIVDTDFYICNYKYTSMWCNFVSDTSRPMRHGEVNGKEYFFVTREKMEEEIEAGKFIEFGEYKGNLYGTSAESVKSLVNAGYVCILNPHYQVSSPVNICLVLYLVQFA